MTYLVDTGVLLRAFDRDAAEHKTILQAIRALLDRGEELVVAVQNLAEFWNVATRPKDKNGGLELSIETVSRRLRVIERLATVASEDSESFQKWKQLLTTHRVLGVKVHDARLVSVMLASKIGSVITLNERDFQRYSEVVAVRPEDVLVANPDH
jgi:predicted nucleic acid-binding protein